MTAVVANPGEFMAAVRLDQLRKVYPNGHVGVADASFEIADGELLVLVGPSGCGKTTLLRMIAGLESISAGTLSIDGRVVNAVAPKDRDIAMVFQNYALYPHMTVAENLGFGLKLRGHKQAEIDRRVAAAAQTLELESRLAARPAALSGGQRQRVALGRALVREPRVFLLDEPLSNLDAKLRLSMRVEIARLHRQLGATMIYVTHDQIEAMSLADRIVIMNEGVLQQNGSPEEVYAHPTNMFVARFVGSPVMNIVDVGIAGDAGGAQVTVDGAPDGFAFPAELLAQLNGHAAAKDRLALGVRPEGVLVRHDAAEGFLPVEAHIIEPLGAYDIVDLQVGKHMLRARTRSGHVKAAGDRVYARVDPSHAHFFDRQSEASLGVRL
jgi:multiple sugar transport system ATP-binding protein